MKQTTIEKLSGLQVLQNSLTVSPGYLERADNVTIVQDYIVTKARGMHSAYQLPSNQIINQLFNYGTSVFGVTQNRLVRFHESIVTAQVASTSGLPTITVTKTSHGLTTGDFISAFQVTNTDAFVAAFPKRQAAFYGIREVTVIDPNTFTIAATENATATVSSGATAASYFRYTRQTGEAVSVTAGGVGTSRVVKSNKNAYFTSDNGIMKLEREDLPVLKAGIPMGLDLQGTLGKSTTGSTSGPIGANKAVAYKVVFGRKDANGNLVLGEPSEALVLRNTIIDIPTADLSYNDPSNVLTVTYANHGLTSGDTVYLYNVVATGGTIDDGSALPVTVLTSSTFSVDFDDIGVTTITAVTSISFGVRTTAYLTSSLPSEITSTDYLYQIYRTTESIDANTLPEENYRLVYEANVTSAFIAQGFITFTDEVDQILVQSGSQLYTNPTVEGPLQENARPPRAKDVVLFGGYVFYLNVTDYRSLDLSIVAPSLLSNGDYVTLAARDYIFRGNADNEPVGNESTTSSATTTSYVEVTQTNHGMLVNDIIRVTALSGITGISVGTFTVSAVPTANTFRFSTGASGSGTVTYEGVSDSAGKRLVKRYIANSDTTLSESIDLTTRLFIKAVNRDAASPLYARNVSAPNGTPGKMNFQAKNINASSFSATVSASGASDAFVPSLPTIGTTISDTQSVKPNAMRIAKYNEPEAVPRTNELLVASEAAGILRGVALRTALIIWKEDGVYRLNGDNPNNFAITALDTTVILKATNSVAVLNNSAYGLTNQGVVQATDSSVRISSREIEPFFSSIIGNSNIEVATSAISYESERTYMLSTLTPGRTGSLPDVTYVYNYLTNAWTTYSGDKRIFATGLVSSIDDKLLSVQSSSKSLVNRERKDQTKIDFTDQETCVPILLSIISQASTVLGTNVITVTTTEPHGFSVGNLLSISNVSSNLISTFSGGAADVSGLRNVSDIPSDYEFSFEADSNALASITGSVNFQRNISEQTVAVSLTNGSSLATFTTSLPHNLVSGLAITVHSISSAISAALSAEADLVGYRTVSVLSPTSFTATLTNAATGTASGTANMSDRKQQRTYVTAITESNYQPQEGDAIISGNSIFVIDAVTRFSSTAYVLTMRFKYKKQSTDLAFINSSYKSSIRFSPLTFGSSSQLKFFSEFQATFRNNSSCTKLNVNFSTDAFVSSDANAWSFATGTSKLPILFGGWGSLPWGRFPWGGGTSIQREFTTRPAVGLRMYIPKQAYMGTFLQPILEHRVAGEPFELQSIAIFQQTVTQRTTR